MTLARTNSGYREPDAERARSEELRILAALPGTDTEILVRVNRPAIRGEQPMIMQPGLAAHLSMMPVERGADGVVRMKART